MHFLKRFLLVAGLSTLLIAVATCPEAAQTLESDDLFDGRTIDFELPREAVRAKSLLAEGNDKIDPGIRALVAEGSGLRGDGFTALAKNLGVPLGANRSVAVALTPEPGASADDLIAEAEANGAEVSVVFDDVVFARVPLDSVDRLGSSDDLNYMNRQLELKPAYPGATPGGAAADGVGSVNADRLHARGITGQGVRVGILDFGFEGYRELQGKGMLPAPAAARAFNRAGTIEKGGVHGTACAEIVHAMAPDAEIYLAAIDGAEDQIIQAAFWLAEQGIDILSFSGGGHAGPHNGRALLDRLVASIAGKGILWVNAAGNEGASHWGGKAVDRNRDGWIDIGPGGENFMVIQPKVAGISVLAVWDDWGLNPNMPASTEDIDAYLFQYNPKTRSTNLIGKSVNPQRGRGKPLEFIGTRVQAKRPYLLALRAAKLTRPVTLHVYSNAPAVLAPQEPQGSIGIPAAGEAALAVGAVDVRTNRLEAFSSQGPTDDGRLKPEVSGPDNTRSAAYARQGGRFPGTSAACPHVSGFAALIKQMRPESRGAQLRQIILKSVRAAGSVSPNYGHGYGYIDASRLGSPEITVDLPQPWGGQVPAKGLDDFLEGSTRDPSLKVKVAVGRSEYRLGDGLKIGYTASEDCYYLLLGHDSEGKYVVISPLGDDSPRLVGGEQYLLPQGNQVFRITEPTGVDEVILIGSRDPVDLADWRSAGSVAIASARYRVVR